MTQRRKAVIGSFMATDSPKDAKVLSAPSCVIRYTTVSKYMVNRGIIFGITNLRGVFEFAENLILFLM